MFKDENRHYSLRKLSVGLASVLIGISFASSMNVSSVKADTVSAQASAIETKTSENKVNTNVDASKDVANTANSVDSNKITPSQTVLNKQTTSNDKDTDVKQEQVVESDQNSVAEQNSLLDDLGKQKASTENNQAEARNQKNRLVDQINYKLTNNTSTDNKEDLEQNLTVPDETKQVPTDKNDAEKSIVRTSSLQEPDNQSNNHAEDNSQTQTSQKLDLTKNSKLFNQKELATNLTQDSNDDWGTDPSKYGFHKTNAGWTKLQQGKDYTSVAKDSHTILLDSHTSKELSHNNSFEVADGPDFGTDITATIDKTDIKQGNRILISSTAELYKDGRHFLPDTSYNIDKINVISNGVKIGHIEASTRDTWSTNTNSSYISYFLVVDQTQNMIKDLDLHIHLAHTSAIDWWGNHWMFLKGTTPDNPAQIKLITNDDTTYNYTVYADSTRQAKPQHIYDSVGSTLNQDIYYGNLWFDGITRNPDGSSIPTDYTLNKVFKFSRPKSVNGVTIPNFKSTDFVPNMEVGSFFPILSKDGVLGSLRTHNFNINGVRLTDGLSVQQVTEAAKRDHVVYSISNDGQSMLVGINFATNRDNLAKLTGSNYSADDAVNDIKGNIGNTRALAIDYPNEANDITTRSVNWAKNHNGEPYQLNFNLNKWPTDTNQPNIQTITDVTLNTTQHEPTVTNSSFPKDDDLHFDASVYKQLNVKFIDDDDNEKVINNDTFNTSTGTDLTYNIKDATDKTFNSATDIAFPTNLVLNQPTTVHYGVVKDTNPDIIIHVKHKHQDVTMSDPNAETTREYRVIERRPAQYGGNKIGVDLVVHAHKTADKDLVTGNITYGNYLGKTTTFEVKAGHPRYADQLSYFNSIKPDKINGYITMIQNNWSSPERDAFASNQSTAWNHILYFSQDSDGTYTLDFMDGNPHGDSSNRAFAALPASRDFYVDYVAEPQSIQVKFIDQDNAKKQVGDVIKLTGVTDSHADFTSVVNTYKQDNAKHYLFVNTDPSQLSHKFTAGDKTIITINLKHQHAKSTAQAPATRTIVVHMPDGSTKTYVQTIGFVNNLDEDLVTNVTTNVYTVDASKSNTTVNGTVDSSIHAYRKTGNDDANGTNYKFASFVLPKIPGYTAHIKPVSINPNMRLFSVSFMALPKVTPDVTQKVKPEPAKPAPIETQVPVGTHDSLNKYTLTTNDSNPDTRVFNNIESDQATQTYDVVLSHQTEAAHRTHEVHETVDYVYADGKQAAKTFESEPLIFSQTGIKDLVNGKIDWNGQWTDAQSFATVDSPEITGYTPSQKTINAISVSHDSKDVNQIVIYTANTQKAVITYVDDTDGDIVACDKTSGRFGEMIKFDHNVDDRIKAFENQGYRLVSNNFDNQTYMANNEQNAFVVHLTHGKTNVQRDDIVTETIEYQFEDGQKAHDSMIQQIKFVQNGIQDSVTKSVVWTPSKPQQFESVTTPHIDGYTPNISQISAKTITFGDSDLNYVVKYIANMQNAKILYIDDNTGTLLKSEHAIGKFNTIIDFNINPITQISEYINSGYRLVSNNFNNQAYKTDNDQNRFTVHLAHSTQNVQRSKTLMRVIKYQYTNGQKASDDVVQTAEFTQQGVKDLVNDEITWSQTSDHQFARVITPQIVGYCPDKTSIDTETISYDAHNQTIIVTYKAQELPAQLRIIDDTTGQVVAIDDASGKYHELIEFNDLQKQLQDLQKHGYQITSNTFNNQHYNVDKSQNIFEIHVIKHDDVKHDDIKHDDIKHDDIKHDDIKHDDIKHEDIKHEDIKHEDIKHEDIKHEDIKHEDIKPEDIKHDNIKHEDIKHEDSLIIRKVHKSEKTLPQTGAEDTRIPSVIGAISSLIAGLGLVGVSRKKHKKND